MDVPLHDLLHEIMKNYPGIIIDEVHFLKNWSTILKVLYDSFPDRVIWTSDSSSVLLRKRLSDLSRRFVLIRMPLMSFREFIHFETEKNSEEVEFSL
ncbi:AAA family ATPase [Thermotoga sp. Mc24]|uniref:AAA family ATPase n=1 Tax=Thermotoga sp. Mc24 TaxID=1231241 RepID=UPI000ADB4779|nr:AAA family ATPase [Thermotoga sp. Mc24]